METPKTAFGENGPRGSHSASNSMETPEKPIFDEDSFGGSHSTSNSRRNSESEPLGLHQRARSFSEGVRVTERSPMGLLSKPVSYFSLMAIKQGSASPMSSEKQRMMIRHRSIPEMLKELDEDEPETDSTEEEEGVALFSESRQHETETGTLNSTEVFTSSVECFSPTLSVDVNAPADEDNDLTPPLTVRSSTGAFVCSWQPNVSVCGLCSKSFWLFRRRHHCRSCGICICSACCASGKRAVEGWISPDRVCKRCVSRQSSPHPCTPSVVMYMMLCNVFLQRELQRATSPQGWKPNALLATCPQCDKKFNVFRRRHHCRQCGDLVCGSCSSGRNEVLGHEGLVRVCDRCNEPVEVLFAVEEEEEEEEKEE